jgi:hypothetical protein
MFDVHASKELNLEMKLNCLCCGAPSSTKLGSGTRFYVEYVCGTMALVDNGKAHLSKTPACDAKIWETMVGNSFKAFIDKKRELNKEE